MLSLYVQPAAHFLPKSSASSTVSEPILDNTAEPERISRNPRDPVAFLYYSIVLTCLTVIVAIVIGVLQLLTLILNAAEPEGKFWDGVEVAGEYYDVIGGAICGCFLVFGGISVLVYPRWRRWIGDKYALRSAREEGVDDVERGEVTVLPGVEDSDSSKDGAVIGTKSSSPGDQLI